MKTALLPWALVGLAVLAGCGGGSGPATADDPAPGVVSGTVTKGPVGGASVTAYGVIDGSMGGALGSATTDANGNFTLTLTSHAGGKVLAASGGSYVDEATGAVMAMAPQDVMTAALPAVDAGAAISGVQVTPVTAMAQTMAQHMAGGMTDANIAAANAAMGRYFSIADVLHTHPMNPLLAGAAAGAGPDERNYGLTLAAMSQYAKDQRMANASGLVTAMMADAADGMMDGRADARPITMAMGGMMGGTMGSGTMAATAGTSGMSAAMTTFLASGANASGMTAPDAASLIQRLASASGRL